MTPVRLESAVFPSRVKHSTTGHCAPTQKIKEKVRPRVRPENNTITCDRSTRGTARKRPEETDRHVQNPFLEKMVGKLEDKKTWVQKKIVCAPKIAFIS